MWKIKIRKPRTTSHIFHVIKFLFPLSFSAPETNMKKKEKIKGKGRRTKKEKDKRFCIITEWRGLRLIWKWKIFLGEV